MGVTKVAAGSHLDRCNLLLLDQEGNAQGTGVLWRPSWVLTCAHVVGDVGQQVSICESLSEEPLTHGVVKKRGNPRGPDDLAWVELKAPLHGRVGLGGVATWDPGEAFVVSGFPSHGRDHVSGKVHGQSRTIPAWFTIDARSNRNIEPGFSGAAVWSVEKRAVIGVVAQYESDGIAHVVPKPIIDDFLPSSESVDKSSMVDVDCSITNLSVDRWVRVLDAKTGKQLGNGFRLDGRQVLTSSRLVEQAEALAVGDYPHFRARAVQEIQQRVAASIAILVTTPVETQPFVLPASPIVQDGLALKIVGYRADSRSVADRVGFLGQLIVGEHGVWHFEETGADLGEDDSLVGSSVFLAEPLPGKDASDWPWALAGVLDRQVEEERAEWVVRSLESVRHWVHTETAKPPAESEERRQLQQVRKALVRSEVSLSAILDQDVDGRWALARHDAATLASCLCLETDPDELTYRLFNAYCDLADVGQGSSAEEVFDVLMHALPSSLGERWPVDLPEPLATETRLGLSGRILVDFVLAASEGGKSEFFVKPPKGTDFPLPTHQLPESVGELGYDLQARDVAIEVSREAATRVAMSANSQHLAELVGFWASRKSRPGSSRWIDPAEFEELKAEETPLLQAINQYLAEGTRAGRRFYFLAGAGDEPLVRGLKRIVPELKVVTLESQALGGLDFGRLRRFLKNLFNRRHRLKESNP